ncbi:MAG: DUF4139 domain-containing protein [Gemmatimonadales bacterium]
MSVVRRTPKDLRSITGRWGRVAVLGLTLMLPLTAYCSPLAAQTTSLTIYNDGRVLVRRTVAAEVPRGSSTQRLSLGALDLSTLFSADSSVVINGATYDGATDQQSVLRRALGRRLLFRGGGAKDTVSAEVVGVDPERYRMPDGTISFSMPGIPLYPEDLVVLDPLTSLSLRSGAARNQLKLGYFTAGAQWRASYQIILGSGTAQVTGAAVLQSQSLKVENAEIQLLAGSVSRATPYSQVNARADFMMAKSAPQDEGTVAEQKVGEFHLYTLPGRSTLLPGVVTSAAMFDPAQVRYERNYVVRGQIPYWGGLPQYGEETETPVQISYLLQRPRKTDFGDRPLAGGVARIYQADSAGRLQLVGESSLDHTPAGEDLRLPAGTAFDLTAKRVQTTYVTRRDSVSTGYWQTSATADYRVTLKNASDSAVTIEVLEQRGGEWSVLSSSVTAQRVSSTITRFRVPVPAQGRAVLKYRVRVIW